MTDCNLKAYILSILVRKRYWRKWQPLSILSARIHRMSTLVTCTSESSLPYQVSPLPTPATAPTRRTWLSSDDMSYSRSIRSDGGPKPGCIRRCNSASSCLGSGRTPDSWARRSCATTARCGRFNGGTFARLCSPHTQRAGLDVWPRSSRSILPPRAS